MNAKQLAAKQAFEQKGQEIGNELDARYIIPKEKIKPIIGYYAGIMASNPQMKVHRIVKKVVAYFKLQSKANEN